MNTPEITDVELQRAIDSLTRGGHSVAGGLGELVEVVHTKHGTASPPPVKAALSEFVDVSLIVDKGDLPATAASNASGPATQVAELPKRRETISDRKKKLISSIGTFIGTVTGKVVIGTTVAIAARSSK